MLKITKMETGEEIKKEAISFSGMGSAERGGHGHYMIKEILEQPESMRCALMQDREKLTEIAMDILRARNVIIIGMGTSRHAALIGRYLFSKVSKKFCDVVMASEFHYFADSLDSETLVIAVSQSGETADVMAGVKKAKGAGAGIVSIVNVVGSTLARISDRTIYMNCGYEIGVAATKTFVNELVIFYLLSYTMACRLQESMDDIKKISKTIEENLEENLEKTKELAKKLKDSEDAYYIARGINFAIAVEGALKLKEISYIHAEGMPAGELKHGTISLVDEGTPVFVICPDDYTHDETLSNAAEAKARGARIIGISDRNNEIFDEWIRIPKVDEIYYPLACITPLQLLAYFLAVERGKNPDKPRNLAKSVTVK